MKPKYIIFFIILSCSLILLLLINFGDKLNQQNNGFSRRFIRYKITEINSCETDSLYGAVIGSTSESFYFKLRNPGILFRTDKYLNHKEYISFNLPAIANLPPVFLSFVDSPSIYILGGNIHCLIRGDFIKHEIEKFDLQQNFTKAVLVSKNSAIVRARDSSGSIQYLRKINFLNRDILPGKNILDSVKDGGFATDGTLLFEKSNGKVFYINYYNNEFCCFDTLFHLIYRANTVDTFSHYVTRGANLSVPGKQIFSLARPAKVINKISAVDESILMINSALKADNENPGDFDNNDVIDLYNATSGKYVGSFYLPKFWNEKLRNFKLEKNLLLAIYEKHCVCYRISFS
ncbi:MAG TPA: hypothetical protein VIH86_15645 [Puia sp.]